MTPNERLALRHLIKLCLSTTTMEEVIHRERLRQAEAAVEADRAAEQQKVDEAKAYVQAFDARSRKLAEQAKRSVGGN